jgi:hypothetical protein
MASFRVTVSSASYCGLHQAHDLELNLDCECRLGGPMMPLKIRDVVLSMGLKKPNEPGIAEIPR